MRATVLRKDKKKPERVLCVCVCEPQSLTWCAVRVCSLVLLIQPFRNASSRLQNQQHCNSLTYATQNNKNSHAESRLMRFAHSLAHPHGAANLAARRCALFLIMMTSKKHKRGRCSAVANNRRDNAQFVYRGSS